MTYVQGPVHVQGDVILDDDTAAIVIGEQRFTRADIERLANLETRVSAVEDTLGNR